MTWKNERLIWKWVNEMEVKMVLFKSKKQENDDL